MVHTHLGIYVVSNRCFHELLTIEFFTYFPDRFLRERGHVWMFPLFGDRVLTFWAAYTTSDGLSSPIDFVYFLRTRLTLNRMLKNMGLPWSIGLERSAPSPPPSSPGHTSSGSTP